MIKWAVKLYCIRFGRTKSLAWSRSTVPSVGERRRVRLNKKSTIQLYVQKLFQNSVAKFDE